MFTLSAVGLGLDQLHGDVVHDLAVHGDLWESLGRKDGLFALVDDFTL